MMSLELGVYGLTRSEADDYHQLLIDNGFIYHYDNRLIQDSVIVYLQD